MRHLTDDEKLMQQALDALDFYVPLACETQIRALRARLAQTELAKSSTASPAANDAARSAWRKRMIDPGY